MSKGNWWKLGLVSVMAVGLLMVIGLTQDEIKNPDTVIYTTYGSANTLDPAYSYDTASGAIIFNVYEGLVRWPYGIVDADQKDLTHSLAIDDLLPMLATEWEVSADGTQYRFKIRDGVSFHEGGTLTPSDVEYTFERGMLQDRDGGPQWMLLEPLTGYGRLYQLVEDTLGIDTNRGAKLVELTPEEQSLVYYDWIDPAVETDGDWVIFSLPEPYPPFLTILAHSGAWGSILDKEWVIEVGGWDGDPGNWVPWYNPGGGVAAEASELYEIANGTGPYKLVRWDVGVEVVYEAFEGYWGEPPKTANVVVNKVQEWSDRLLAFKRGDADICQVDPQYLSQVVDVPGLVWQHHLPTLSLSPAGFFTSDFVTEGNDLCGSCTWAEDGLPSEFFNDAHCRKAFAYAFEYQTYIDDVYELPGGYMQHGPVPRAFAWAYKDDPALDYSYDMEKATEEMKLCHGGKAWETGFTFTMLYNEGNQGRRVASEIMEKNIESMNPKFHAKVQGVPWSSYLDKMVTTSMPLFWIGWLADYPDPHNFVVPFARSDGTFAGWQGDTLIQMFEERYDPLIEAAMETTVQAERAELYYQIQERTFEDAYDIWIPQVNGYRNIRDWVQDYPFNPIFPGPYFAPIYKAYEE